ncbi:MAG TPA: hypothetical protein ENN54_05430, partial [Thermoplasmatales archaeon]|nr:hypothetical protein [Thermoplasmatales archaeon]
MKKSTLVIAALGVAGLLLMGGVFASSLVTAHNGNGTGPQGQDDGYGVGDGGGEGRGPLRWAHTFAHRFAHAFGNRVASQHCQGEMIQQQIWERTMGNLTEVAGTLTWDGEYYRVDDTPVWFGPTRYLENSTARSDYDRDGTYESMAQELAGLEGSPVTIKGIQSNDMLIVRYVNGIWYRAPVRLPGEIVELVGILTCDDGYTVGNQSIAFGPQARLFNTLARSDYDQDGQFESMYDELEGLTGTTVTLDGFYRDGVFVPLHINSMLYRP